MAIKVYLKTQGTTADERKMIKALQKAIKSRVKQDAGFEFTPARNLAELKAYYIHHCAEDAAIISETKNPAKPKTQTPVEDQTKSEPNEPAEPKNNGKKENTTDMEETIEETTSSNESGSRREPFLDPMLQHNPNIRDYVTDDTMQRPEDKEAKRQEQTTNEIPEPNNFDDAFKIPGDNGPTSSGPAGNNKKQEKPQPKQYEPVNPKFDEMSTSKKNKQTKRFAKYIVETTAMLTEKGCIWWTTKDINDIKLAEYELEGVINLEIMLSMDENQQMTVRQFFKMHCEMAKTMYTFTDIEKEELADALYDVMIERGIAPTPMQTLLMVAVGIVGKRLFTAFITKVQIGTILHHRAVMKEKEQPDEQPQAEIPHKEETTTTTEEEEKIDPEDVISGKKLVSADKPKKPRRPRKNAKIPE